MALSLLVLSSGITHVTCDTDKIFDKAFEKRTKTFFGERLLSEKSVLKLKLSLLIAFINFLIVRTGLGTGS